MVKKKRADISFKTQLAIATGIVLLLAAFGLFIGWLDSHYKMDMTVSATYADVTIKGESTCLPHKDSGSHTMECAQGIKTSSGIYYGVEGVVDRNDKDNSIEVTGTLKPASNTSSYDITGIIKVK